MAKTRRFGLAYAICIWLGAALPASGHHSTASYDLIHGTIIQGIVMRFEWENPHAHISLDVTGENNELEHWSVELEGANILRSLGWKKETLKPGDEISVTGGRARNGSFRLRAVFVQFPDGRKLQVIPVP